jgi:hypothetical protein
MQTLSFQQNNRASSDSMTFQFHQDEAAVQHVDHRASVLPFAPGRREGRMVVAWKSRKLPKKWS